MSAPPKHKVHRKRLEDVGNVARLVAHFAELVSDDDNLKMLVLEWVRLDALNLIADDNKATHAKTITYPDTLTPFQPHRL